jgi:hypothetical protein
MSQVPDYCFGFLPLFVMYRIWQNQSKIAIAVAAPMDFESIRCMERDDPLHIILAVAFFTQLRWDYTLQLI